MSTFTIPMMFLQCLVWNTNDGDVIDGFRFEQPVTIMAHRASVEVKRSEFAQIFGCFIVEADDNSRVLFSDDAVSYSGASGPWLYAPAGHR